MPVDSHVQDGAVMYNPDLVTNQVAWHGAVGGMMAMGVWCMIVGIVGMAATGCRSVGALIAVSYLISLITLSDLNHATLIHIWGHICLGFGINPSDQV